LVSFLYGWTLFGVIQTGTIAAVAVAFAKYTGVLIPWFSEKNYLFQTGSVYLNGEPFSFKFSTVQLLAIVSIVVLTWLNGRGVKNGKLIQNIFGSTKIIAILILIVLGFAIGVNAEAITANFTNMWEAKKVVVEKGMITSTTAITGIGIVVAIGLAMTGSLFSSDAWNNVSFSGDEVVNPSRTLVRSLAIGTGLVTFIYILVNFVYLLVLPINEIQTSSFDRVAASAAEKIAGNAAVIPIAILIMISTFGCNNGCILSGARVYYAMAKDKLFFKGMGTLNKNGVPAKALNFQCVWACLLCLFGAYSQLLGYVMLAVILFYILTIAGIFILRKNRPDIARPYKAFGYPVLPLIYILLASAFCYILLVYMWDVTRWGLLIVLLGVPVYFILGRSGKKVQDTNDT
jgi:APA family basic amino acid/polyamine antiporter